MLNMNIISKRNILLISFVCGALIFVLEYLFCIFVNTSLTVMGVKANAIIENIVFANFQSVIILSQIKILAIYILLGGLAGLCICYNLHLYSYISIKEFSLKRLLLSTISFCLAVSFVFLMYDITTHPALYNETFYARGGILREFQLFLTDRVPRFLISALRISIILFYLPFLIAAITYFIKKIYNLFKILPIYGKSGIILIVVIILIAEVTGKERNEGPNLIILSADSFRYDRVSAYGYHRNLTPNVDKLVNEGFSFRNLHVQLPRTFPSWYCLLTGKYPHGHGIRHMFPQRQELEACEVDLPVILKEHGYTTSVVADYAGDIFSRMKGFERVDAPYFNFDTMIKERSLELHFPILPYLQNKIGRTLLPELKWFYQNSDPEFLKNDITRELNYLSKKKRFFLIAFFSVTHFPYASPYPYYKMFTKSDYRGEYKYLKINDPTITQATTEGDKKHIRALFDGACRSLDEAIGHLIRNLKDKGLYDNTIIIFTSDHGENIYDHGLDLGHGQHFRGELATHVPFIIKFHKSYDKNVKTKHYDGIVEQIDFLPTILDVLGIDWEEDVNGISFKDVIEGKRTTIKKIAYSESGIWFVDSGDQFFQEQRIRYPDVSRLCRIDDRDNEIVLREEYKELKNIAKHRAVFDERYKLIYIPTRDGILFELYRMGDNNFKNLYYRDHPQFRRL